MVIDLQKQQKWSLSGEEEEDITFKLGFQDELWKKFSWSPVTPPTSPSRSIGESSDSDESIDDQRTENSRDVSYLNSDMELLQDVSDNLDCTFDFHSNGCSRTSDHLQTKLISDCMWSGSQAAEYLSRIFTSPKTDNSKSLNFEYEKIYPTPCPSPSPSVAESDYNSNDDCVDPTSVFPLSMSVESLPCHSESEEEIDVVTVDAKPVTIAAIGVKRKICDDFDSKPNKSKLIPVPENISELPIKIIKRPLTRANSTNISSRRGLSSSEESDIESKDRPRHIKDRETHNTLEKKRRIDLKKSFEKLKNSVPELEEKGKVSKLTILQKASMYINFLYQEEMDLSKERNLLENEKEMLLRKLQRINQDRKV